MFAVKDRLTDEVRQESLWTLMFADDTVVRVGSRWRAGGEHARNRRRKVEEFKYLRSK